MCFAATFGAKVFVIIFDWFATVDILHPTASCFFHLVDVFAILSFAVLESITRAMPIMSFFGWAEGNDISFASLNFGVE